MSRRPDLSLFSVFLGTALCVILIDVVAAPASAIPIRIRADATVYDVGGLPGVAVGDPIRVEATIDDEVLLFPASGTSANTTDPNLIIDFRLVGAGYDFAISPGLLSVSNDVALSFGGPNPQVGVVDAFSVGPSTGILAGLGLRSVFLSFVDETSERVLAGDRIPVGPELSDWIGTLSINVLGPQFVEATVDSVQVIPEPGIGMLLGLGLMGLCASGRKSANEI